MGNSTQTRYIDADKLIANIYNAMPSVNAIYTSDPLGAAINQQISTVVHAAFIHFVTNLMSQIERSAMPYENDKCMLCKQRDHDVVPDFPYDYGQ